MENRYSGQPNTKTLLTRPFVIPTYNMPDEIRNGSKLPYPVCCVTNATKWINGIYIFLFTNFSCYLCPFSQQNSVTLIHINSFWVHIGHTANRIDSKICEQGCWPLKPILFYSFWVTLRSIVWEVTQEVTHRGQTVALWEGKCRLVTRS